MQLWDVSWRSGSWISRLSKEKWPSAMPMVWEVEQEKEIKNVHVLFLSEHPLPWPSDATLPDSLVFELELGLSLLANDYDLDSYEQGFSAFHAFHITKPHYGLTMFSNTGDISWNFLAFHRCWSNSYNESVCLFLYLS